jgi:hypothetical protein
MSKIGRPIPSSKIITYVVSVAVVIAGAALIVSARALQSSSDSIGFDVARDFGITLCTIGSLSIAYEALIRQQLIADITKMLVSIVNPDVTRLRIARIFGRRDDHDTPLAELLRSSKNDVLLYGLTLYELATEKRKLLRELTADKNRRVRMLIFNVQSPHKDAMAASLGTQGGLVEYIALSSNNLRAFEKELRDEGIGPERFEVRVFDIVPTFGLIGIDVAEHRGRVFVEWNAVDADGDECPGLELQQSRGTPYEFFTVRVEKIWAAARPLTS